MHIKWSCDASAAIVGGGGDDNDGVGRLIDWLTTP